MISAQKRQRQTADKRKKKGSFLFVFTMTGNTDTTAMECAAATAAATAPGSVTPNVPGSATPTEQTQLQQPPAAEGSVTPQLGSTGSVTPGVEQAAAPGIVNPMELMLQQFQVMMTQMTKMNERLESLAEENARLKSAKASETGAGVTSAASGTIPASVNLPNTQGIMPKAPPPELQPQYVVPSVQTTMKQASVTGSMPAPRTVSATAATMTQDEYRSELLRVNAPAFQAELNQEQAMIRKRLDEARKAREAQPVPQGTPKPRVSLVERANVPVRIQSPPDSEEEEPEPADRRPRDLITGIDDVSPYVTDNEYDSVPVNSREYFSRFFGRHYLSPAKPMNRYVVDDSTEGRLWAQATSAIGPLNRIKDWIPIKLSPAHLEAQYMEWVQNVVRMHRQCRVGVFSRFAFRDIDTRMEIDLLITIDGRRLDPKMRLLPPSIQSHGFPTFRNMCEMNLTGLFHIPAGVFADAWKLKVRRTMDLRFVNH